MKTHVLFSCFAVTLISLLYADRAASQLMSRCVENSPERRGQHGCSIIEKKLLPDGLKEPVFWHIDRFDTAERARRAVGPTSVSFEAAGTSWLMTIEPETSDHHGGHHVAKVGPLQLPKAEKYSMQVQSAVFAPGMYSLAHHHSGVEAVYVVKGEACYETPTRGFKLRKARHLRFRRARRCARSLSDRNLVISWRSSCTTRRNLRRCRWKKERDRNSSPAGSFGIIQRLRKRHMRREVL
jgi:hypothetical protein